MKTHGTPPPPPNDGAIGTASSSDGARATEADGSLSQDTPSRTAYPRPHHHDHRHPPEPAPTDAVLRPAGESVRVGTGKALMEDNSDGATNRGTKVRTLGGPQNAAEDGSPVVETRGTRLSSGTRHDDDDGRRRGSTCSDGSGTLWIRVMPTDEISSEEDSESPLPPVTQHDTGTSSAERRGREDILRGYLGEGGGGGGGGGGDLVEPKMRGGSQQQGSTAEAHSKDSDESSSSSSSRGAGACAGAYTVTATAAAKGGNRSPSPGSGGNDTARAEPCDPGRERGLHDGPGKQRPGIKRDNRLKRMFATDLAAAESHASGSGAVGSRSRVTESRPCLLNAVEAEGLKGPLVEGIENRTGGIATKNDEAWSNRGH